MAVVLKIRDREFKDHIRRATAEGLQQAGVFLYSQCMRAVNKSNPFKFVPKSTKKPGARRGGQKKGPVYLNMHNAFAGQPPFKRTGDGQANIVYEYNDNEKDPRVRVGVSKDGIYMVYLELGTRRILARPWLLEMLNKHSKTIGRLCCTGGQRQ
jgi:hypothetical protein